MATPLMAISFAFPNKEFKEFQVGMAKLPGVITGGGQMGKMLNNAFLPVVKKSFRDTFKNPLARMGDPPPPKPKRESYLKWKDKKFAAGTFLKIPNVGRRKVQFGRGNMGRLTGTMADALTRKGFKGNIHLVLRSQMIWGADVTVINYVEFFEKMRPFIRLTEEEMEKGMRNLFKDIRRRLKAQKLPVTLHVPRGVVEAALASAKQLSGVG